MHGVYCTQPSGLSGSNSKVGNGNVRWFFRRSLCVEDVDDIELEQVLSSNTECHSKVTSLIHDNKFHMRQRTEKIYSYKKGMYIIMSLGI